MKCIFILLTVFEGGPVHINSCEISAIQETQCLSAAGPEKPCTHVVFTGSKISVKETAAAVLAKLPK